MFMEFLLGLVTVAVIWDYLYKRRINAFFERGGIRGPSALPIIGCCHHALRDTPETIISKMQQLEQENDKTFRVWILHKPFVVTSDVRFLESILSSQEVITKSILYVFLQKWLGDGLALSTGTKWRARRKIITPAFHFKILEQFLEIFDQQSAIMMQVLSPFADGKTAIDIFPIVCSAALDTIAETAMGVKINAQLKPDMPYVKALKTVTETAVKRVINPTYHFDWLMNLTAPRLYQRLQSSIALMHDFTDKVIKERRAQLETTLTMGAVGNNESKEDNNEGVKKYKVFLDVLLQSNIQDKPLTNREIREEVDTFMFGGHDTTTSGISFACYLISRHPEVQQKLFQEIRDVIGDDKERCVTMSELNDLKYLDCVIKESLRLYPSVPIVGRHIERNVVLNGIELPAKTNLILDFFNASRDPKSFNKPDEFIPERFYNIDGLKINPFASVPFSAGPRNCIGSKYALLEMKSTISKLLRYYELLPLGEPVRPVMSLILRSANGVCLGLKPRVY